MLPCVFRCHCEIGLGLDDPGLALLSTTPALALASPTPALALNFFEVLGLGLETLSQGLGLGLDKKALITSLLNRF